MQAGGPEKRKRLLSVVWVFSRKDLVGVNGKFGFEVSLQTERQIDLVLLTQRQIGKPPHGFLVHTLAIPSSPLV